MELTPSQKIAYKSIVIERLNTFVTGAGGTGKSELIKHIIKKCSQHVTIGLTSTTGISACSIGGVTLHSYLGLGMGTTPYEILVTKIRKMRQFSNWKKTEILIIDEVSMLSAELFDKIDKLARVFRKNDEPFGGIQIVLFGDFLQLKPVGGEFCFRAKAWSQSIESVIELREVVRQSDRNFIDLLMSVRLGKISDEHKAILKSREIEYPSDIIPTSLFALNSKVNEMNDLYYAKLGGDEYKYETSYDWNAGVSHMAKRIAISNCRMPETLALRVGAQVMHLVNKDGLFNGSRGVVTRFVNGLPEVKFADVVRIIKEEQLVVEINGNNVLLYTQIPLKLAYAATIHKSQGMTLDLAIIDFENIFEAGQFYVALSRVRSLEGLFLRNIRWSLLKADRLALRFHNFFAGAPLIAT